MLLFGFPLLAAIGYLVNNEMLKIILLCPMVSVRGYAINKKILYVSSFSKILFDAFLYKLEIYSFQSLPLVFVRILTCIFCILINFLKIN